MLRSRQGVRWLTRLLVILGFVAAVAGILRPGTVDAQTCGTEHTVKEGDTLAQIAARAYGNPTQWTVIFYANQDRLGAVAETAVHRRADTGRCRQHPGGTGGRADQPRGLGGGVG